MQNLTEGQLKRQVEDYLEFAQNQGKLVYLRLNAGDFIEVRGDTRRRIKGCQAGTADLMVIREIKLQLKKATRKFINELGFENVVTPEVIFLELKSAKGKQSDAQKEFQVLVEAQGCSYFLIRSIEKVMEVMIDEKS